MYKTDHHDSVFKSVYMHQYFEYGFMTLGSHVHNFNIELLGSKFACIIID